MKEDFNKLRLRHHGDPEMMETILQRECRYKTASKLPVTLKCKNFRFPSLAVAEMATSDAVAAIHSSLIPTGATVLDMTFGLGIDTFHFSKRAAEVTAVELNSETYRAGIENIRVLGLENVRLVEGDSLEWLKADCGRNFDVIFVDPARRDNSGRHFALKDCQPDIIPALPLLLTRCRRLIIKASPMLDIKKAVEESGCRCKVITIGTVKECKELLLVIDRSNNTGQIQASVVSTDCLTVDHPSFSFTPHEDTEASPIYATPAKGYMLLEPYPSVMKGGGMKLLSERFGVAKLHPNTTLFTSSEIPADFPGEYFKIIDVIPFGKQAIKNFAKNIKTINVAVRNFPLSAPQLAAKLKIREGGDSMVFGTTTGTNEKLLVITTMGQPCPASSGQTIR